MTRRTWFEKMQTVLVKAYTTLLAATVVGLAVADTLQTRSLCKTSCQKHGLHLLWRHYRRWAAGSVAHCIPSTHPGALVRPGVDVVLLLCVCVCVCVGKSSFVV